MMKPTRLLPLSVCTLVLALAGCTSTYKWVGIRFLYDEAPVGSVRVLLDVPYLEGSTLEKHRLDLLLPEESPEAGAWPVLIFVHGGGWTAGDKGLKVSSADVYRNIGRFYARHGIGTAVINYRLQPEVTWREQVADVAHAVSWVHSHAAEYGGDPGALYLSGHSAGAQLSAYVALNPGVLREVDLSPRALCGVIAVSGAGYDLADERTYELGAERSYYEERFRAGDPGDGWLQEASAVTYLSAESPPFLLIHGSREWKSLQHQNRLLDQALRDSGAKSRLLVATQTHLSILLALSREDKLPAAAVLQFIRETHC